MWHFLFVTLSQVSDYNRVIVIESNDEEIDRVLKERAQTSEREDDTEEISKTKVEVYNENTRSMNSLGDSNKAVKVRTRLRQINVKKRKTRTLENLKFLRLSSA